MDGLVNLLILAVQYYWRDARLRGKHSYSNMIEPSEKYKFGVYFPFSIPQKL